MKEKLQKLLEAESIREEIMKLAGIYVEAHYKSYGIDSVYEITPNDVSFNVWGYGDSDTMTLPWSYFDDPQEYMTEEDRRRAYEVMVRNENAKNFKEEHELAEYRRLQAKFGK